MPEVELEVPYVEKDFAKSLGAKWNPIKKIWYVPSGMDPEPFIRWLTHGDLKFESAVNCKEAKAFLSLSDYLLKIAVAVSSVGSQPVWLKAEISHISAPKKGNIYLELVEHGPQGNTIAKARAAIWRAQVESVFTKFEQATQSPLVADIKIMVLVTTKYDPLYGTTMSIEDIDPAYTLGDMAEKLTKIRQQLQNEKLYDKNKAMALPINYQSIAVISPVEAAGLGDFKQEASILEKYALCKFKYFPCLFQGVEAPLALAQAMEAVWQTHATTPFDALIIIRGGGAVTDLAWLNDYQVAKAICLSPVPVFTGIGHQKDNTILDEVAKLKFDTPSKVSGYLFTVICKYAEQAEIDYQAILKQGTQQLGTLQHRLMLNYQHIGQVTAHHHQVIKQQLDFLRLALLQLIQTKVQWAVIHNQSLLKKVIEQIEIKQSHIQQLLKQSIKANVGEYIQPHYVLMGHHCTHLAKQIMALFYQHHKACTEETKRLIKEIVNLGPQQTLNRGFVLVRNLKDGAIITRQSIASQLKRLTLQFYDGHLIVQTIADDKPEGEVHEK